VPADAPGPPASHPPADHGHYFDDDPQVSSAPTSVELTLPDLSVSLSTDRGVFSRDRIDPGTKLLLIDAPALESPDGTLVDLGCGYGPIAVALAHRAPRAQIWAVDVNRRAVALAAANLAGHAGARAVHPDDVPSDLEVDEIWSNPPIRIGKPALHELLDTWHARLRPDGRMVLVVHRHLGADSLHRWLESTGRPTTRVASRMGYRLLEVRAE